MEWHQAQDPSLKTPYPDASWPAATVNLGPQTVATNHRDEHNLGGGQCADVAGGTFKWSRGGHLVLHEIQKIIQLRPGRMVLFPSAAITHENLPVGLNENRFSYTSHLSAGLVTSFIKSGHAPGFPFSTATPATLWKAQESLLMTVDQLVSHWVRNPLVCHGEC